MKAMRSLAQTDELRDQQLKLMDTTSHREELDRPTPNCRPALRTESATARTSTMQDLWLTLALATLFGCLSSPPPAMAAASSAPQTEIPFRGNLKPKPERPIFVVASSGIRVLASWDDGKTWKQVFLASDNAGDGGHGPWGTHALDYRDGLFTVYSGWGVKRGQGAHFLGSVDGEDWRYLAINDEERRKAQNVMDAVAAPGVLVTSGTSISTSHDEGRTWKQFHPRTLGVRTHHMKPCYGDYDGGRLVVAGDGPVVFYSKDKGLNWHKGDITGGYTQKKGRFFVAGNMVYGNGIFLINSGDQGTVVRSTDGGESWSQKIDPGAKRIGYRGLNFIKGEFWLTGQTSRASKDGLNWRDLPAETPRGPMAVSEQGTIICVTGPTIMRSTNGRTWTEVFTVPKKSTSWNLRHVIFGLARKPE